MNTGIMDAHNVGWKLALVVAGRAPDALLDSYGTERFPVARDVLKLTDTLVRYGTISHPVKRRVRDLVVPALGRTPLIQRRAISRLSHVYVTYPPGPLVRSDGGRGRPRPGQRMPDVPVRADGQLTTLHRVLRGGRHVLLVPAAHAARVLADPILRPYCGDLGVASADATPVVLIRPDGHVAARGRPGSLEPVAGYLHDLFGEPAGIPGRPLEAERYTPFAAPPQTKDDLEDAAPRKPRTGLSVPCRTRGLPWRQALRFGNCSPNSGRGTGCPVPKTHSQPLTWHFALATLLCGTR
jgi:hypothetical protein